MSENNNLPSLLRDDTICVVDRIVRVRREGIASMAQHWHACLKAGCSSQATASLAVTLPFSWRALA